MKTRQTVKGFDLKPAKWVWAPVERTLPNTFVLFRKEIILDEIPQEAVGWITADSRYCLTVNGKRVQWGPAPCDPRWVDVDPVNIRDYMQQGKNVIGIEVLWYGEGEGTYIPSNPGLIAKIEIIKSASVQVITTDSTWKCFIERGHLPGKHKQFFLRALQEDFDARKYPYGWNTNDYAENSKWVNAYELPIDSSKPTLCGPTYTGGHECLKPESVFLRKRQIPLMKEYNLGIINFEDCGVVFWKHAPEDWFDFRLKNSFDIERKEIAISNKDGVWEIPAASQNVGYYLTFSLNEQIVGWPFFSIEAPEGTVVELMEQESHDINKNLWMDTHFYSWQRFICKEGRNDFAPFDFYSFRWIQLHIHGNNSPVKISNIGTRRRTFDIENEPYIRCKDDKLNALFYANINTIKNSMQEIAADGMGRERQQYCGDGAHQLQVFRYATGDYSLSRRFVQTFGQGMTLDGYFMDCWPGIDRLHRLAQRQLGTTQWGPILDHSVQFVIECWNLYLETGNKEDIEDVYDNLIRFGTYLESIIGDDGLLPVEDQQLGIPSVWLDHCAWGQQRHKRCPFNLYVSAMFIHALAPICRVFEQSEKAKYYEILGGKILERTIEVYWCPKRKLFIDNLPWEQEEDRIRMSDRTLGMALLFDQCPGGMVDQIVEVLAKKPASQDYYANAVARNIQGISDVGLSYPCNAVWRYWGLIKYGKMDVIVQELRTIWAEMDSVKYNKTVGEFWVNQAGSTDEWSHCAVAPLSVAFKGIAGIRPVEPGYKKIIIEPQLADIKEIDMKVWTPWGVIEFRANENEEGYYISYRFPQGIEAVELVLDADIKVKNTILKEDMKRNKRHYHCDPKKPLELWLKF